MMWYYHGKHLSAETLPAYEILQEWYKLIEEKERTYVQPQRAASGPAEGAEGAEQAGMPGDTR